MAQTTQPENYPVNPTLYIAIELSSKTWKLAMGSGGRKVRSRSIPYGSFARWRQEVEQGRKALGLPQDCRVLVCEEAGRDGFWIHRELERMGYESLVIDPSSVRVNQRSRRAKTDRIDAKVLLHELVRYDRYDEEAWSVVRVPQEEEEDDRRPVRELYRLTKERGQHVSRIRSLLALHGIKVGTMVQVERSLEGLNREGKPLPPKIYAEIRRQLQRWRLVEKQIQEIEREQREELRAGERPVVGLVKRLRRLKGVGKRLSWVAATEVFRWRTFRNRKEVGALAGLCGSPYNTGVSVREQGISKAGSPRLRGLLIEAAWCWVKWQPDSDLTIWYRRRFAGDARRKKAGIVAVARRLLIELWHWVEHDVVPKGAILQDA